MKDWKSTVVAILSGLVGTLTTITAFLAPYLMTSPQSVAAKLSLWSAGCTLLALVLRVWVGVITNNADAAAVSRALNAPAGTVAAAPTSITLAQTPSKLAGMLLFCLVLGCLFLTGCTNFERDTFNSLSASKAVIDGAQADYTSGKIPQTSCSFALINDAKASQTVAVNAMLVYEGEKNAGQDTLNQANIIELDLGTIVPLIAEVKMLYVNPAACAKGATK